MNIGIDARLIDQTGVGRYIRNLYKELKGIDKDNQYLLLKPKIKWHSLSEQIIFPFWLLFKKADLIHFPYFSFPIFCPKPFVVTIHDLIPWHFKTGRASSLPGWFYGIKHFFYKQLLYLGARRAKKIIAVSQATKKDIIKCLKIKPDKVNVIYEGIDDKLKVKSQKSKVILNANCQLSNVSSYFLYVGNAYPHKNLEMLIEAFSQLSQSEADRPLAEVVSCQLLLVGPDDYFYKKLKAKVSKLDLQDKVIFHGPATDEQLTVLYLNSIALINPSLMEGFGLPGLEAMSIGCPVICSKIAVFEEIYGNSAEYFDPEDIQSIQDKIEKMLNNEKLRRQLINAGKKQVKKYSWEKCARQTLAVYESCSSLRPG